MVGGHCEFEPLGVGSSGQILEARTHPGIVDQNIQLPFSLSEISYKTLALTWWKTDPAARSNNVNSLTDVVAESHVLFWGNWYPCFWWFLVMSPLGFKAREGSALFALQKWISCIFPEIHPWYCTCWPLDGQLATSLQHSVVSRREIAGSRNYDLALSRK